MITKRFSSNKKLQAYVIGLALGDGNLSNPNGRAVRLRITCDKKYPQIISNIRRSLEILLPNNKVFIADKTTYLDVSCYSNFLPKILGWYPGSKSSQKVKIPDWIIKNNKYTIECLRGLIQTDGSIYLDRGYKMINFTSTIHDLAWQTYSLIKRLGYNPHFYHINRGKVKEKYVVRLSKSTETFIREINLWKK